MDINKVFDVLKQNDYKVTTQRQAILEVMTENSDTLMRVEQIYDLTKNKISKTNMSTVYRNIEILDSLNLLHKSLNSDGSMLYKIICSDHHHHHLVCTKCGKIKVIEYCPIKELNLIAQNNDFELHSHNIELYGLCKNCKMQ